MADEVDLHGVVAARRQVLLHGVGAGGRVGGQGFAQVAAGPGAALEQARAYVPSAGVVHVPGGGLLRAHRPLVAVLRRGDRDEGVLPLGYGHVGLVGAVIVERDGDANRVGGTERREGHGGRAAGSDGSAQQLAVLHEADQGAVLGYVHDELRRSGAHCRSVGHGQILRLRGPQGRAGVAEPVEFLESQLGVGGAVAVDGSQVDLAVDQHVAHPVFTGRSAVLGHVVRIQRVDHSPEKPVVDIRVADARCGHDAHGSAPGVSQPGFGEVGVGFTFATGIGIVGLGVEPSGFAVDGKDRREKAAVGQALDVPVTVLGVAPSPGSAVVAVREQEGAGVDRGGDIGLIAVPGVPAASQQFGGDI